MTEQHFSSETLVRIGHRLRRLRLNRDATQKTVEAATGLNHGTMSRIENGRYPALTVIMLEKFCRLVQCRYWSHCRRGIRCNALMFPTETKCFYWKQNVYVFPIYSHIPWVGLHRPVPGRLNHHAYDATKQMNQAAAPAAYKRVQQTYFF